MLDVHQQQFLMLMLVVEAQVHQRCQFLARELIDACQQVEHPIVDVGSVVPHLVRTRPGDESALGAWISRPHGFVVTVEQRPVRVLVRMETGLVLSEYERLEEPRHMRAMPLCWADVGHGLDRLVFRTQWCRERFGESSDRLVGGS